MNNSISSQGAEAVTMSSDELLDLINEARDEAGEPAIRRNKLAEKIEDELEGEHYTKRVVRNSNNTESSAFDLTRDQCLLVSMRESKVVRRKVVEKLNAMAARPMTQAEIIAANANHLVAVERQQREHQVAIERIETRVSNVEQVRYLDSMPAGFESMTSIRARINLRHGIPQWVINAVMRDIPGALLPFAMVRSKHAEDGGQPYAIWPKADITRRFDRFAAECTFETAERATHPDIEQGRFKLRQRNPA